MNDLPAYEADTTDPAYKKTGLLSIWESNAKLWATHLKSMQKGIHPTYYKEATISCACGATFVTGSTIEKLSTEICSQCHPFYTGKKKFVDTTGRVDRFKKLTEKAEKTKAVHAEVKKKRAAKSAEEKKEGKAIKASAKKTSTKAA